MTYATTILSANMHFLTIYEDNCFRIFNGTIDTIMTVSGAEKFYRVYVVFM